MNTNHNDAVREINHSTGPATAVAVSTEEIFLGIVAAGRRHTVARFVLCEEVKAAAGMRTATLVARVARWRKVKAAVHCV